MSDCHDVSKPSPKRSGKRKDSPLIALVGQPNVGKSTVFNLLTGMNQHVGNWPGKTVERKEGNFKRGGKTYTLVDLPGTYSLSANSAEELITREFILTESPDLVVALVNAANLERSLYLVAELVTLPAPLLIVLNMMDVAKQEGYCIEPEVLEAALGVPVIALTATHNENIPFLVNAIQAVLANDVQLQPKTPTIRADHQEVLDRVLTLLCPYPFSPYPREWVALKLLEGDTEITRKVKAALPDEEWQTLHDLLKKHDDALLAIASGRYEWIGRMTRAAVTHPKIGQISLTDRLDRWAAHPLIGLIILGLVLGLVFWLTFTIGSPAQTWLENNAIIPLGSLVSNAMVEAPGWLRGVIVDGVIGGVGSVLTFLPILIIFFASFGFLEDIGYMARAAFVMDKFMHWMGLHGKSFLPLFLGFGCNVPAVIGTRVIDSWKSRLLTILLAPLVPCTARMAVVAFLAPIFFGRQAIFVVWGLVALSIFILILLGVILNRVLFKGERSAFIMEMPLYHIPNWRTIGLLIWQRSMSFIKKAGTTILILSLVIWALSYLPNGDPENNILSWIGRFLEPAGRVMGLDWRLTVALLTSFMAKENTIATLGVLFGNTAGSGLAQTLVATYSPATALAFLTVSILFIPCAATVAVIRQETGSWKWTFLNISLMLVISVVTAIIVFQLASLIG
jgi:ferrous iron transport protein B